MAKKFWLPLFLALVGLTLPTLRPTGFTMLVVDEQTGLGVPNLLVVNKDGMVRRTGTHGELIIWSRSSPLGPGDRFEIQDERRQFVDMGVTLSVTPHGRAVVKINRRT